MDKIRESIHVDNTIKTPYGDKKICYLDYIASGRPSRLIDDIMNEQYIPYYANTHSSTSELSIRCNKGREKARELILKYCGGTNIHSLVFVANGATGASNLLADMIFRMERIRKAKKIVVFNTIYEHHSNILPYREKKCTIEILRMDGDAIDYKYFEERLSLHSKDSVIIAAISACSNVTGLLTDTDKVTQLVHKYGGLVFFDYAANAPYEKIDMKMKDAIFFSMHKFIGGQGCPGILIFKKYLFKDIKPRVVGGGTVKFVSKKKHVYLKTIERHEAGTPNVLGCIRAGLAFQLKQTIGINTIHETEGRFVTTAMHKLSQMENICIVGNVVNAPRLAFFSFLVKHENMFMHPDFCCMLLNDMFGIQMRSGCMCAGPYVEHLLGLKNTDKLEMVLDKYPFIKPGVCRFSLNYFISQDEFNYVMACMDFISRHGYKFLLHYTISGGEWTHRTPVKRRDFDIETCNFNKNYFKEEILMDSDANMFEMQMKFANEEMSKIKVEKGRDYHIYEDKMELSAISALERVRWFVYPFEIANQLTNGSYMTQVRKCFVKV